MSSALTDLQSTTLLQFALCVYGVGGVGSLAAIRREKLANLVGFGSGTVAAICGIGAALLALIGEPADGARSFDLWPSLIPFVRLSVKLDPLSAFFVLIVSVLALALSIYSFGYVRGFYGRKSVGALGALYNALLLATTLVFTAGNALFFLVAWEIMALTAYCLVSFEHEQAETRNAGVLFFIMSHVGTGCLIVGFLLLFQASGQALGDFSPEAYSFENFRALGSNLSPGRRDAAFVFFLLGFGVKAGIVPLHVWLPAAHPVAPSNASALLSGVMIKTGIYGLTRVLFDFLGTPPNWWGITILTVGTVSAVLGVLYALMEHDLKRLLAYHSIENIGIILMGLGAALMFLHTGHPVLASLALIAGLYHTLNHAIFKALLFLGAGAVLHATRTRNMEAMGGLIKRMPKTAFFFLMGAVAISALPPLNGFVSEWLTYQSLLQGFGTTSSLVKLMFPLSGAMLALTGALAAACFVKAFGITFLAQPRSEQAAQAHEASPTMLLGMGLLTVACVFLGLFPTVFLTVFGPLTQQLLGQPLPGYLTRGNGWVLGNAQELGGTVSTLGILLTGLCLAPVPLVLWLFFGRRTQVRIGPTWDCGLRGLTPQMEYTATGFSKPLRMIFKALFRPHREVQREYDYSPYFATTLRFESHIEEAFVTRLYRPFKRAVLLISRRMRVLQAGSIQAYLIYIFVTLLLLLLVAL
ncbi:MAG TPA: hydrogenase 4 subunit B [Candidatus Paceibacterota bacterium]|nr:hydrogenase 4 subunit B [Verrucomicrobiota bacterium]HSA11226.1 hydrogenase 4 subunit B [Candidatus Paceibacterota bacterium]